MSLINKMKSAKSQPVRQRKAAPPKDTYYPSDGVAEGHGFVANCVRLADSEPEASRGGSAMVHVSALVSGDWCPRSHLIQQAHSQGQSACVNSQMRIVWTLGRAAEAHVRNQFIRMHGKHRVIGRWLCKCEKTEHVGPGEYSKLCPTCGTGLDTYGELTLTDHELGKTGNPDLIFIASDEGLEVVEIKSIKKDGYERLFKAESTHVLQGQSYVRVLRDKLPGKRIAGRVLYVAKDYIRPNMSPYLEFEIEKDAAATILDVLDDGLADMREHEKAGTLPDRLPACVSPHSMRAKNCVSCGLCFAL